MHFIACPVKVAKKEKNDIYSKYVVNVSMYVVSRIELILGKGTRYQDKRQRWLDFFRSDFPSITSPPEV